MASAATTETGKMTESFAEPGPLQTEGFVDSEDIVLQTSGASASSLVTEGCSTIPDAEGQEGQISEEDTVLQEVKRKISENSVSSLASSASVESFQSGLRISEEYRMLTAGLHPRDVYEHGRLMTDVLGVVYNGRTRRFIMLDGKGVTTWSRSKTGVRVERALEFPAYQYRLLSKLVYARKHNCYFALTRDFQIKVLDSLFKETCSVNANLRSVLFMIFCGETDELITAGVGGTKIWHFHQVISRHYTELKPLANYRLSLRLEIPEAHNNWVRRVEVVLELQHLILCSDRDVYVHHFTGDLLYSFISAHDRTITSAVYSSPAKYLITAGMDAEVKVWSYTGGSIHTFRGHSQAVTTLLLVPTNAQMVISGSLDGSIKFWSLETMEPFFSMTASSTGILYMGLTDDDFLYISTARGLSLWAIHMFYDFWSLTRDDLRRMWLARAPGKSTRVITEGTSGSMRIFGRKGRENLSTVCPPPNLSPLQVLMGCCYSRIHNLVFMLLSPMEVWVYTTRTDPACRIAVWNLEEIQSMFVSEKSKKSSSQNFGDKTPLRALMHGLGSETVSSCMCITLLHAPVIMNTDEGLCCPIQRSFLLLGMEDGRIMFMDPMIKGHKHLDFLASKDPVIGMYHDEVHETLVTQVKVKRLLSFQFWELPKLTLQYEIFCPPDITSFARCGQMFLGGFETGSIHFIPLQKAVDTGLFRSRPVPDKSRMLQHHKMKKPEHETRVNGVDVNTDLRLFLTCSSDGAIKLWQDTRHLLAEIQIDAPLSAACFLNRCGTIIMGTKNQLYSIHYTHVLPPSMTDIAADAELDAVETESYVYEDPAVAYEGIDPCPDPLTLARYLVPFNIEFSKDFLEGRRILDADEESEMGLSESSSESSTAPTDIYLSPRESPATFSQIDMRLAVGTVLHQDLNAYMKNTLAILEKIYDDHGGRDASTFEICGEIAPLKSHLRFEFPEVGISPGGTPERSLSIASQESLPESKEPVPGVGIEQKLPVVKRQAEDEEEEEESSDEETPPPPPTPPKPPPAREEPLPARALRHRVNVGAAKIDARKLIKEEAKKQTWEIAKKKEAMEEQLPASMRKPPVKKQPMAVRKLPKRGSRAGVDSEMPQAERRSSHLSVVDIPQRRQGSAKSSKSSQKEEKQEEEKKAESEEKKAESEELSQQKSTGSLSTSRATDSQTTIEEAASTGGTRTEDGETAMEEETEAREAAAEAEGEEEEEEEEEAIHFQVPELPTIEDVPATAPGGAAARGRGPVKRPIDVPPPPPTPPKPPSSVAVHAWVPTPPAATQFGKPSLFGAVKEKKSETGMEEVRKATDEELLTSLLTDSLPAPPPPSRASHVPGVTSPGTTRQASDSEGEEKEEDEMSARRPATSYHPLSRKESLADRPHSAEQREQRRRTVEIIELEMIYDSPEDLEQTYEKALSKYYSSGGGKLLSSDGTNFEANWHEREIERHMLLKLRKEIRRNKYRLKKEELEREFKMQAMQSLVRKSSTEPCFVKMPPYDLPYSVEGETVLTFGGRGAGDMSSRPTPAAPATSPQASRPSTAPPTQLPAARRRTDLSSEKEAADRREKSAAKAFRCRLRGKVTETVQDFRRMDVDISKFDPRNPQAIRPKSCRSIPSKCNRYVLISRPKPQGALPAPSMLEEQLLVERFPKQGLRVLQQFQEVPPHRRNKTMYGIGYSPYTQASNLK